MEGTHTLQGLLKQGDWMAKIDLQDAYLVPIHKEHRIPGLLPRRHMYHFSCLLSSAFTKTLKPTVALLRGMGLRLVVYIDDILVLADTPAALSQKNAN